MTTSGSKVFWFLVIHGGYGSPSLTSKRPTGDTLWFGADGGYSFISSLAEDNQLAVQSLVAELERKLRARGLHPYFITGHTGWTDNLEFAFAHRDKLCSPFKKRVHDPSAPYDAYDESDDTEENAKSGFSERRGKMKDSELQFDRTCHVLYSKSRAKRKFSRKIALHYPEAEREAVWEQVQLKYAELLSKWRTDLGGKKRNFHNGAGGTYDCIAIMCFYDVCRDAVTFREMEEIEENLILPTFRKLKFVDCNKPFWKKLMYKSFTTGKSGL